MTTTTVTNIGYTGTVQNANVLGEYGIPVNAYLWGGGGGSTSQAAGNAGGYSKVYFVAKPGDILTVAVGQGGGVGGPNINPWTPSGFSGAAYSGLLFNTRFPPPGQDTAVVPYGQGLRNTSSNSTSFLSQWGVWGADQNVQTFTRTYTINFPATANVIFQMVASTFGRVYLDGNLIVEGAGRTNTGVHDDTINKAFVKVTAGNHTITIQADGSGASPNPNSGNPNAIGVIFGTGDLTTYAGGRGGQIYPADIGTQVTAGGGGGATIVSLNGVVIAVAAGGAGGATRPAVEVSYVTTNYAGSTATQPFSVGITPPAPPVVIAPGTSGYYINILYQFNDVGNLISTYYLGYSVVVNGVIVYMNQVGGGGPDAVPPPLDVAQKTTFVGNSYVGGGGGPNGQVSVVQCWNFIYTSLNVNGSTDFRYNNGQDGQDVSTVPSIYGYQAGGGGGGGGGLWAGQGGSAGYGAPRIGGTAGVNGTSLGDEKAQPVQRTPYINDYYPYGGVAEGGASGTTAIRYVGTTATDPFHSVNLSGSGYYVRNTGPSGGSNSVIGYYVIVNGTVIYQSLGGAAVAPPATLAIKAGFVGYSYNQTFDVDGVPHYENVECFSFDYVTSTFTNGGNGFVALEYQTGGGGAVKDAGSWKPIQTTYVKDAGTWKPVQTTYINVNGIWKPTQGAPVPIFIQFNGAFAPASRNFGSRLTPPPPPPAPDYGGTGVDTGYGGSVMF